MLPPIHLAARIGVSRWLTGRPDLTVEPHFEFPRPADSEPYGRFFGQKARFDQPETKLVFEAKRLERVPVGASAPAMTKRG